MKIAITGAHGFLGWHARCRLLVEYPDAEVVALGRDAFSSAKALQQGLSGADLVLHFAGINRADDKALEDGNQALADTLVKALQAAGSRAHVIYANSVQCERDIPYGRGKQGAHRILLAHADDTGTAYSNLVLPHLFGECGKPNYNAAVFTFCQQLVDGKELQVNPDGRLELLHAQQVMDLALDAFRAGRTGTLRPSGTDISVPAVAERLTRLYQSYTGGIIPDLRDSLDLQLFNMLRTFLFPAHYPVALELKTDERGSLFESVKTDHGGQAFLSTTHPGITRGNHYHFHKVERFLVIRGNAVIRIRRLFSDQVHEFHVSGDEPVYVDMPPLHTHNIENTGTEELMTLFWSHEIFDPQAPDTYFQPVETQG
jgi:UDP-2-acetamido-2,6-beta-L-arabino-hexul-4-ose reductase